MRRERLFAATVLLLLLMPALAACTGDGQVASFERAFADDPAVESLVLTSHDNQPFSGGVSGEVVTRPNLPDADVLALTDRISSYTHDHGDEMRGRVSISADGFEVVVTGDDETDAAAVATLLVIRADDRVRWAEVGETSVSVIGTDVDAAIALAEELPGLLASTAPASLWSVFVRTEDRAVDVGDTEPEIAAALAVWRALDTDVPLTGMRLRGGDLVITLRDEADFARAQERGSAVPIATDVTLRFASDLIRLGDSDGAGARALVSALEAATLARISYVWESGTRVQIGVRSARDRDAVIASIGNALPAGITDASVEVDGDADTRWSLPSGIPDDTAR